MARSIEEIKSKLQKLYTMMETNSNASQSEVESALKSARQLMYKYKLSEKDFLNKPKAVIKKNLGIVFSTTTNPWVLNLNRTIAANYCCKSVMYKKYHSAKKEAGIIGFEDDVEIAEKTMRYAVDCILAEGKKIRKTARHNGYSYADITSMINAYGNGWARGIKEAFEEQNKTESEANTSFAVVMVTPPEVDEVVRGLSSSKFNTNKATNKARNFDTYAVKGFNDGKKFNMHAKLDSK